MIGGVVGGAVPSALPPDADECVSVQPPGDQTVQLVVCEPVRELVNT